jgi:two-component system, NarL family, response regulator NreC
MQATSKIRVLVADDHAVLRAGLRMLINAQPDMEVVGEAADSVEALKTADELQPEIVLMDISMPGNGGGLRAMEHILERSPRTRVLVLTMHEDPAYMRSAMAAGANGYLVKKAADTELISAIRAVHRGRIFIDSAQADDSPFLHTSSHGVRDHLHASKSLLSERELQVLQLLAQGYTNQKIAERIFVSVKTVETYRYRLTRKLELHSRSDLVRFALEVGLLNPDKQ